MNVLLLSAPGIEVSAILSAIEAQGDTTIVVPLSNLAFEGEMDVPELEERMHDVEEAGMHSVVGGNVINWKDILHLEFRVRVLLFNSTQGEIDDEDWAMSGDVREGQYDNIIDYQSTTDGDVVETILELLGKEEVEEGDVVEPSDGFKE